MRFFAKKQFVWIIFLTLLFCITILFDVSPLLRGPAPYPPEWQWEFHPEISLVKMLAPLSLVAASIFVFFEKEKEKTFLKNPFVFFGVFILLSFLFQLSILFYSRSGIFVLLHRILNPEINGYFTAAIDIKNLPDFLHNYKEIMLTFVYHAKAHPPGAVLLFYGIEQIVKIIPGVSTLAAHINPQHSDVSVLWNTLSAIHKATAVVSAFVIPFLSTLAAVPLYYTTKLLYGEVAALRSSFLYMFVPSIVLFIPINDVLLPLFSIASLYFLVKGLKENTSCDFFLSGLVLFIGVFFNLSLLPVVLFFFLFCVTTLLKQKETLRRYVVNGGWFTAGLLVVPLVLFALFQFNFFEVAKTIMQHVPDIHTRSYATWLFYNIYDFFIFAGIPVSICFVSLFAAKKKNVLFVCFVVMLLILNLSGTIRGETGRIWSVFMPFMCLFAAYYLSKVKTFTTKQLAVVLLLQAVQIIVMQGAWVLLW